MQLSNIHQYATCEALQKYVMSSNMQLPKDQNLKKEPLVVIQSFLFQIKEQHGHHLRKPHRHPYHHRI
jgi:hypothetical protein